MTIKRVRPPEVAEAFRVTGLTPARGDNVGGNSYFSESHACGMGALYIQHNGRPPLSTDAEDALYEVEIWTNGTYDGIYCCGFVRGFDGTRGPHLTIPSCWRESEEFQLGYLDGMECAAAMGV